MDELEKQIEELKQMMSQNREVLRERTRIEEEAEKLIAAGKYQQAMDALARLDGPEYSYSDDPDDYQTGFDAENEALRAVQGLSAS